ncbi:MAG: TRAP transporter small permease subunit [Xanthobacteraceae bacterium]
MNDQRPKEARLPSGDPPGPAFALFPALLSGLNSVGTLWIFALMIVITLDVVGRTVFNSPLPGVLELVRLSIVGIVFIQLGHTLRAGRMTRSDNFIRMIQRRWPRAGYGLQAMFSIAGIFIFFVLFKASLPLFVRSWTTGEYAGIEGYISYPVWPVRLIILIGSACAGVQFLLFAWRDLSVVLTGRPPVVEETKESEDLTFGARG